MPAMLGTGCFNPLSHDLWQKKMGSSIQGWWNHPHLPELVASWDHLAHISQLISYVGSDHLTMLLSVINPYVILVESKEVEQPGII